MTLWGIFLVAFFVGVCLNSCSENECVKMKTLMSDTGCLEGAGWSHGGFDATSDRINQLATMGRPLSLHGVPLQTIGT